MGPKRPPPGFVGSEEPKGKKPKKGAPPPAPEPSDVLDLNQYVQEETIIPLDKLKIDVDRTHGQVNCSFCFQ